MRKQRLGEKVNNRLFLLHKYLHQRFRSQSRRKLILFIMGCQRSGTTLMIRLFRNDLNTGVYNENSKLSSLHSYGYRINPLPLVRKEIHSNRASFIVLKPLVESQRLPELLSYFEHSQALWMYRSFRDVAASNVKSFGIQNSIKDIRPIYHQAPDDWRSEVVPPDIRKLVADHFSEEMNPYDAAVLFWCARNSLYFEFGLETNPDVLLCNYEDLTRRPAEVFGSIYDHLNQGEPTFDPAGLVHAKSIDRGKSLALTPSIEQAANEMMERLNRVYRNGPLSAQRSTEA